MVCNSGGGCDEPDLSAERGGGGGGQGRRLLSQLAVRVQLRQAFFVKWFLVMLRSAAISSFVKQKLERDKLKRFIDILFCAV